MALPPPVIPSQSLRTIQPVQMSLKDWADRTTGIVQKFGFLQQIADDDWVAWGMNLVKVLSQVKGGQIPRPDQFSDWRTWAVRINQVIER